MDNIADFYSKEEIEANRTGQLTDEQIETLKDLSIGHRFPPLLFKILVFMTFSSLITSVIFHLLPEESLPEESATTTYDLIILLVLCGIYIITGIYIKIQTLPKKHLFKQSLTTEQVLTLKHVTKRQFTRRQTPDNPLDYWYEYIGDPLVQIVEQYDLMEEDATYTLYYWSYIFDNDEWEDYRWVLSIEQNL